MRSSIAWNPSQYVARGEMPSGVSWTLWVYDETEMAKGSRQEAMPWRWKVEALFNGVSSEVRGRAESSEKAMRVAWGALERIVYAFCTEHPEDWPMALSGLLAAAETAVRSKGALGWPTGDAFDDACAAARKVLAHVPKEVP